ncbi:MAG: glycosyltransferase [Brevibacillus sp.]|nr:glycosyltransferase [Brevibacillus sp.]
MNILLVTYGAYPRFSGRTTYITTLRDLLEQRGHKVDILAHAPGLNEVYIVGGQRVQKLPLRKRVEQRVVSLLRERYPLLTPWIIWRETERYFFEEAIRQLDLSRYDLIHPQDFLSSLACHRAIREKPMIASFHNCKAEEWRVNADKGRNLPIEMAYIAREEYLSVVRQQRVIVPCSWLKEAFVRLGAKAESFAVVPYGMDFARFRRQMRQPTELIKPSDRPLILCPSRLVPIKGHTYLFAALKKLRQAGCQFTCWVAGNGVLEQKLRLEAGRLGLDDVVTFIGGRGDIPAILAMTDIVVLPTLHDTLPLVVMEAQLAGVPVVSTWVGGVVEMIKHNQTGLIGPPRDPDYLCRSLHRLIENEAERTRLANNARKAALATYSDKRMVEHTLQLYAETIRNHRYHGETACGPIDDELLAPIHRLAKSDLPRTGAIVGSVRTPSGRPLPTAIVHLMDISWVTLSVVACDETGRFAFERVPPGKYAIMAAVGQSWNSYHLVVKENEVTFCHAEVEAG